MASNESALKEILDKMDILIRLSALNLVKDIKVQKEQIAILSDAGFPPKQIAGILGTNNNVVSVTLTAIKKKRDSQMPKENARENVSIKDDENEKE